MHSLANLPIQHSTPPVTVADRSKVRVCGRSLRGIAGSNLGGISMSLVSVVCWQLEVFATGRSLVQVSPTEYECVTVCALDTPIIRWPWPALGCCARGGTIHCTRHLVTQITNKDSDVTKHRVKPNTVRVDTHRGLQPFLNYGPLYLYSSHTPINLIIRPKQRIRNTFRIQSSQSKKKS